VASEAEVLLREHLRQLLRELLVASFASG